MLTANVFKEKTILYEKNLKSNYKKNNGIYNTDLALSNLIIDFLDIPANSSVLDPCCGTGSFLYSAQRYGIQDAYGADIDKTAVYLSQELLGSNRIKNLNTLSVCGKDTLEKLGLESPVDFIIGNPPYAQLPKKINDNKSECLFLKSIRSAGSNLFVAAIYRAFEMVKDGGIISYIVPKNFLHISSYALLRKTILKEKKILSIVDLGKYFKEVRGEQILLTVQNCYSLSNVIKFYRYKNGIFESKVLIPQSFYSNEIIIFDNQEELNIYNKLDKSYEKLKDKVTGYVGRGRSKSVTAIAGKNIRKFGFKHIPVPTTGNQIFIQNIYSAESGIIASFAGNLEATETVTIITDGNPKMCHYIIGLLHSNLCNYFLVKYCYNKSTLTMHTDPNYLLRIPLTIDSNTFNQIVDLVKRLERVDYMSKDWFSLLSSLNNLVYKTYGLEINEIAYVERAIKKIQSSRWHIA